MRILERIMMGVITAISLFALLLLIFVAFDILSRIVIFLADLADRIVKNVLDIFSNVFGRREIHEVRKAS